jgi:hypothetical protein
MRAKKLALRKNEYELTHFYFVSDAKKIAATFVAAIKGRSLNKAKFETRL